MSKIKVILKSTLARIWLHVIKLSASYIIMVDGMQFSIRRG